MNLIGSSWWMWGMPAIDGIVSFGIVICIAGLMVISYHYYLIKKTQLPSATDASNLPTGKLSEED